MSTDCRPQWPFLLAVVLALTLGPEQRPQRFELGATVREFQHGGTSLLLIQSKDYDPKLATDLAAVVLTPGCCGGLENVRQLGLEIAIDGHTVIIADLRDDEKSFRYPTAYYRLSCALQAAASFSNEVAIVSWADSSYVSVGVILGAMPTGINVACRHEAPVSHLITLGGFFGWNVQNKPIFLTESRQLEFFSASDDLRSAVDSTNPYRLVRSMQEVTTEFFIFSASLDSTRRDHHCFAATLSNAGLDSSYITISNATLDDLVLPNTRPGFQTLGAIRGSLGGWSIGDFQRMLGRNNVPDSVDAPSSYC